MCRILVAESAGFAPQAADILRGLGDVTLADLTRGGLIAAVGDADVLWVRLRHRIDAEVMRVGERLRVIVSPTTGLNHIDLAEADRRGIHVLALRGETAFLNDVVGTAEHTLALILALLRRLPAATQHTANGGWDRDPFKGREIRGRTAGIVGYGRLGRIVGRYLVAMGARVLVTDPNVAAADPPADVIPSTLDALLAGSDLVSLHVNLTPETHTFFGRRQFQAMRRGSWFVNTARGELVDEFALLEALECGHLAGAALDVLADESSAGMDQNALVGYSRRHDNLIITPHIGGCTVESMGKTEQFMAGRLEAFLQSVR